MVNMSAVKLLVILQSGPNMGPPFPKLFAKNLVFGRSFPAETYFFWHRHWMVSWRDTI